MCRFQINQREKFGCIAIQNAGTAQDARGQTELAPGLWCVDRLPFNVGEFWVGQLGHRRLEQIENSNLLIFAVAPTHRPEVLDDENEALLQKVQRTFYALLLQLVFHHDGAEIFSGARQDDNPDIRTITDLRNHLRPQVARVEQISRANLTRAANAESGMAAYLTRTGEVDRLWHGFHALQRGFLEMWGDERLHQFVLSVEAVLNLRAGKSRTLFGHRAHLFVGRSDENQNWLLELYDLRSATEHMNDYRLLLEHYPEARREHVASLRAYEAQVLACQIYMRLAESEDLRTRFGDDSELEQFWSMREGEQQRQWGHIFDVRTHCAATSLQGPLVG